MSKKTNNTVKAVVTTFVADFKIGTLLDHWRTHKDMTVADYVSGLVSLYGTDMLLMGKTESEVAELITKRNEKGNKGPKGPDTREVVRALLEGLDLDGNPIEGVFKSPDGKVMISVDALEYLNDGFGFPKSAINYGAYWSSSNPVGDEVLANGYKASFHKKSPVRVILSKGGE